MITNFEVTAKFFIDDKVIVGGYGERPDAIFRYLVGLKTDAGWKLFKEITFNSTGENYELAVLQLDLELGQNGEAWDLFPEMIKLTEWKESKMVAKDTQEAILALTKWANAK